MIILAAILAASRNMDFLALHAGRKALIYNG